MSQKHSPMLIFWFSCLSVTLPILCISFMLSYGTLSRLKAAKYNSLQSKISVVCSLLDQRYQNCKDNAVKIGMIPELHPYFMLRNEGNKIAGLDILMILNNYETSILLIK